MSEDPGRRARQLAAVTSFTLFAIQSTEISATIARGVDLVADALAAPLGALIRTTGPGRAEVVHGHGRVRLAPGESFDVDAEVLESPVAMQALAGKILLPRNGSGTAPVAAGAGSSLSVVVVVDGEPWGRLLVSTAEPRVFGGADVESAQMIAAVLGAALERDRVDRASAAVAGFGRFALGSAEVSATTERAIDVVKQVVGAPLGALVRVVAGHRTVFIVVQSLARRGIDAGRRCELDPAVAETLLRPEPLIIGDWRAGHRFAAPPIPLSGRPIAYLSPAIQVDRHVWGRLVASDTTPRRFTPREVDVAFDVARVLAAALQRESEERARTGMRVDAAVGGWNATMQETEIALVDRAGVIVWVNPAWEDFCLGNGGDLTRTGVGVSYLACCDAAHDPVADDVAAAIRAAVEGDVPAPMRVRIACHSPTTDRWFDVLVSSRLDDEGTCVGATVTLSRV